MANPYKDEKGHFTNKENDGGECHHKLRINNGQYQIKVGDGDWEDVSEEEWLEAREGGYQEFDETTDDDFGFDEENNDSEQNNSNNFHYKVGDEVTLEDGSKAKITKDYGEGNFEVLADDGNKYHYDSADFEMYKNRTKEEDERIAREKVEGDVLFGRDMPSNDMDPYERAAEGVEFEEGEDADNGDGLKELNAMDKSKPLSNKGERNAKEIAKMFKGESGPFGGEDPDVDGNRVSFYSQGGTLTFQFNDDGSVDLPDIEETVDKWIYNGDADEEDREDLIKQYGHYDSVSDLFNSGLTMFEDKEWKETKTKEENKGIDAGNNGKAAENLYNNLGLKQKGYSKDEIANIEMALDDGKSIEEIRAKYESKGGDADDEIEDLWHTAGVALNLKRKKDFEGLWHLLGTLKKPEHIERMFKFLKDND